MASASARQMARGGGGPPMPPFARNKPVDYQVKAQNLTHLLLLYLLLDDDRGGAVRRDVCCRNRTYGHEVLG